jgi:hypothetical protein
MRGSGVSAATKRRRQAQCRSAKLDGSRGRGGMADALDLGSSEETRGGSSPPAHTFLAGQWNSVA